MLILAAAGTYKFPYPLMATWIQFVFSHILLLVAATLSRALAYPLRYLGLGAAVAPSQPVHQKNAGYRGGTTQSPGLKRLLRLCWNPSGGIAGGGFFEFDMKIARQVFLLAIVFVAKVVLGNLSFAYTVLPVYTLSRIATVPLTLALTALLTRTSHSVSTLSASLTATLNLLIASVRPGARAPWESVLAGAVSSLFVALFPIILLQTLRKLTASLVPQGDILTFPETSNDTSTSAAQNALGTKEETRAY
ncbi:hypothetical protein LTS18_002586, partial [Coniosporium uncinatum]